MFKLECYEKIRKIRRDGPTCWLVSSCNIGKLRKMVKSGKIDQDAENNNNRVIQ
jgi:hypothetical protein